MAIHYLNGHRLRRSVIAGSLNLIKHRDHLNKINVFPVADGDTGSNMASTMRAILQRAYDSYEPNVSKFGYAIAESALMAARGNSGAILAQFFQGLAEGLNGKSKVSTSDFAFAAEKAVNMAIEAISNPREGTILSVMRNWADSLKRIAKTEKDFRPLILNSLAELRVALEHTKDQLEVLKKANVVDSGASGFVNIVEGVSQFINAGSIKEEHIEELDRADVEIEEESHIEFDPESIHFQFCTEFLLEGKDIKKPLIREQLLNLGDSMIVAGSATKVRVHIHTNEPETIFAIAGKHGTILQRKAEDMKAQHESTWGQVDSTLAYGIVADSSCEITENFRLKYNIRVAPLLVFLDGKEYEDKESITATEFYNKLRENKDIVPKTSQPSPARLKKEFIEATRKKDKVLWFGLSSAVSGTFQGGVTAGKMMESSSPGKTVLAFDSCQISLSSGFMLEEVVEQLEKGATLESIVENQKEIREKFHLWFYLDTVEYLIKGGRMSKPKGFFAKILGLKPVLTFTRDGRVEKVGIVRNRKKAVDFLIGQIDKSRKVKRIGIVHAANIEAAVNLEIALRKEYPTVLIPTSEVSPVLGCHCGPYAFGLVVQYE
ncbi:MAG: DegV family EDD domain-containing protein [Bacteroidetes bacterium]|nr:DegV family EDD domain-containing protein [Bacteroidota bacterium]